MKNYVQHKYCLNLYPYEWDKIKQLAKDNNMEASSYIAKKVFEFIQKNGSAMADDIERNKSLGNSKTHTLVCAEDLYQIIKKVVAKNETKLTRYVINIVLA